MIYRSLNVWKMDERLKSLSQKRMQHFGSFIDNSVKRIMTTKIEENLNRIHINPKKLSKSIARTMQESLLNEKEQYLQDMIEKLEQVTAERNMYSNELQRISKKNSVKFSILEDQNIALREKYQDLNNQFKQFQENISNFNDSKIMELRFKENIASSYTNYLIDAKRVCISIRSDISSIKELTKQSLEKQRNEIRVCSNMINDQIKMNFSDPAINFLSKKMRNEFQSKLLLAQKESAKMKQVFSNILHTMNEYVPTSNDFRLTNTSDFKDIPKVLEESIRRLPDYFRSAIVEEIKENIIDKFLPDADLSDICLNDAIKYAISNQIKRKEEEHNDHITYLRKKEKTLKSRLLNSIEIIPSDDKTFVNSSTLKKFNEVNRLLNKSKKRGEVLDMTMSELESSPQESEFNQTSPIHNKKKVQSSSGSKYLKKRKNEL